MGKSKETLTDKEYIAALEASNAKLSKLLAISEAQKDHCKARVRELQTKVAELIKNSGYGNCGTHQVHYTLGKDGKQVKHITERKEK
jgi:hypothetical protein